MFQTKVVQKIKAHCMFNNFSPKIVPLRDNVEKYGTAGQATDDNIIRTAKMVTRTCLNVTLCVLYNASLVIPLMKQQTVVTHQYTILQEKERTWQILNRPTLKNVTILKKYTEKQFSFCVDTTFWQKMCL